MALLISEQVATIATHENGNPLFAVYPGSNELNALRYANAAEAAADLAQVTVGGLVYNSWTALAAATGMVAGDSAVVFDDAGTHTDPVVGGTVGNVGVYVYSVSPAGWQRVAAGAGTVTSVGGTGTVNGLTLTGTVTDVGNLTLGGTLSGVSLTTQVTGTLPIANGGTGATDAATARSNLGAGTVTSVSGAGTVNGISLTGTVTSTGSLTLGGTLSGVSLTTQVSGTLPVANGGTGATDAATARTNLGATTVGANMFTLLNPSAVTFPRFNADNTVTALDAASFRSAIGAGTSSTVGTVTSVGGTGTVNGITLTGTVTSSGSLTLGGTLSGVSLTTQVSGTLPVANGGTGATDAATARSNLGAGTVTSVGGTGSTNGLTLTGTVTGSGNLTLGGSVTSVDATATANGFVIGYRSVPRSTTLTTAVAGDVAKCIAVSAGLTIPAATFAAGDAFSIYNDSAASVTITQGTNLTLRWAGTANTGNRTLAARGLATVWFNSASEAIISGAGVS